MQHSLSIVGEQMMGQVMLRQDECGILGVLNEPLRASHGTLRHTVFQSQCGHFTAADSDDLHSVCQKIGQPFQRATANSETLLHDVI